VIVDEVNLFQRIKQTISLRTKDMFAHCKIKLEKGLFGINPKFDKLITALRTAVDNEGRLYKEATSHDDISDSYRLALEFYHHKSE
jgi:hypothetical protein